MYTLGSGFMPSANHAGGLRYHGMSPILSKLYHDGYMEAVSVEHLLIKLKISNTGNAGITALINSFGGKVMELSKNFIVTDLTGSPERIQEFIEKCIPFGILELCRSGVLALSTGNLNTLHISEQHGG